MLTFLNVATAILLASALTALLMDTVYSLKLGWPVRIGILCLTISNLFITISINRILN